MIIQIRGTSGSGKSHLVRAIMNTSGAYGDPVPHYVPNRRRPLYYLLRSILDRSRSSKFWPQEWPAWEMREVEHTLCEFDKFERVRLGEGAPRQRYAGQGE